jgi:hypothetical protein
MDNQINVGVGPLVQIVIDNTERVFPFSELALDGDDPSTISDRDLLSRVARWMDRPESDLNSMVVTRPTTGNILISPKAVFG